MKLVLSIFPGIDILGRGFEEEGFCAVRGPDLIFGGDIRRFHAPIGVFDGVIGGPPCQDFSLANRCGGSGYCDEMLNEFLRIVTEAKPLWFLHENVPGCPVLPPIMENMQRFFLTARECGLKQRRNRVFTFGSVGGHLVIRRAPPATGESQPCCMASEFKRPNRRSWPEFCEAMGLERDFNLPGWHTSAKYRAVGNAVPLPMARTIARAIREIGENPGVTPCLCGCGRPVIGRRTMAEASCRKRMERSRKSVTHRAWA